LNQKGKVFQGNCPKKARENEVVPKHLDETSHLLLQHREAALKRVKGLFGCCHLEIDWPLNP
jgi:structure-specific endonuclease subunit SLX1